MDASANQVWKDYYHWTDMQQNSCFWIIFEEKQGLQIRQRAQTQHWTIARIGVLLIW